MSEYIRQYVLDKLLSRIEEGSTRQLEEPSEAESTLFGCLFTDLVGKLIEEAKLQAEKDGTRTISVGNLREARDIILESSFETEKR
ncbi:unnamed protein product [Kluyveromyces dobzhanskii CBS 2104]|uniref:WGS project CCBQ000000000 data, contig 00106 n=1 Tax=Kluyveromyces dobzhanskii CBS 2104 TaxID=1427455 RepID=A0A0A8L7J9_9SACH|nr:unnamed protein product [Kluyveromyces dobzhanskii CBS 2104]